jgi:hypothetical protein
MYVKIQFEEGEDDVCVYNVMGNMKDVDIVEKSVIISERVELENKFR